MLRPALVLGALLLAACISSDGAPGDLCWTPYDCELVACDCGDGRRAAVRSCLPTDVCATRDEACAAGCLQTFGVVPDGGAS
jgi:hypothetical protein